MKFNFALNEEENLSPEELEKKRIRHKQLQRTLEKNYAKTFIKNVETDKTPYFPGVVNGQSNIDLASEAVCAEVLSHSILPYNKYL